MDPEAQTLRETLEAQFEAHEEAPGAALGEALQAEPEVQVTEKTTTDDRPRGPDGKFAPKESAAAASTASPGGSAPLTTAQPPADTKPADVPSTWKKDYWQHWGKLDPALKQYLNQRENEYKTGVSTYKTEAEHAKSLTEAIAPFMPELQKHNIEPRTWISNLGNAHRMLALGSPDQKMQMFARLAQDYGVDLRQMVSGQPPDAQQQFLRQQLEELRGTVTGFMSQQEQTAQRQINAEIESFKADAEKHPHYEQVRETMAGLLQAGIAPDLESAYQKAVWMSDDVRTDLLAKQQQTEQQKQTDAVKKAKSQAISPKTSTPRSPVNGSGPKSLRASLEENFESMSSGRL